MHQRRRRTCLLAVSCLVALTSSASWGQGRSGSIQILPESGASQLESGSPAVMAACALGETRAGLLSVFGFPVGSAFYTLLDPATCSACTGGLVVRAANFIVRTLNSTCTFTVEVTIVGTKGGSSCRLEPDPGVVLCPPFTADIASTSTANFTASLPLSGVCCIYRPAFLRIRFVSAGTCTANQVAWRHTGFTTQPCIACRSFIDDTVDPVVDACSFGDGNPVQWVDADCCDPTPGLRRTWGQLKTLYR